MKQTIKFISGIAITLLIYSCGHHSHKVSDVTLNNGSKWEANPETTTGIDNMIQLMNAFTQSEDSGSYLELESNLSNEFSLIFKNCTMKGEAHNQLHNYLFPMKDLFEGLKSSDLNAQKENFKNLNAHLAMYSTYFE